jgi:hypothetical protein
MRKFALAVFAALLALTGSAAAQRHGDGPPHGNVTGHWSGPGGSWSPHGAWQGSMSHFDIGRWRGGHWWNGPYGGRIGWWWIVGPDWYWYPAPLGVYPDPYTPPGTTPGYWYWCDAYQRYYPYVGACPSGWRAVPPR